MTSTPPRQSHHNGVIWTMLFQRTRPVFCELFRQELLRVRFPEAKTPTTSQLTSIEAPNQSNLIPPIPMDFSTYDMYGELPSPRPEQDPADIPWPATSDGYDEDRLSTTSGLPNHEGKSQRRRLHRLAQLLNESERHCVQLIEDRTEMQNTLNGAAIETLECKRAIAKLEHEKGNLSRALDDARREIASLKKQMQYCDKEHVFFN